MMGRRDKWISRAILALLFFVSTALVLIAQRDVGIARDETVYMNYGSRYAQWWTSTATGRVSVDRKSITAYFGGNGATDNNREHPPLIKTLSGLSERWLSGSAGMDSITAYRLPVILLNALLVCIIFAWVRRIWGVGQGVVAACLTLLLPRAFFHAGLACFDAPIVTLWIATLYAYWRGLDSRRWRIISGVMFGLALATKHNAILLPLVVLPHYVWLRWRGMAPTPATLWQRVSAHGSIAWPLILGPLILIALWPWLWIDPIDHIKAWLAFHLNHVHYNFEYLGDNWNAPRFPWHVAAVTTALTVPAATLVSAGIGIAVGACRSWQQWRAESAPDQSQHAPGLLLLLSAVASIGPFFVGSTPIFGAEKHWAPAIPSLCIAAALGITWVAQRASLWLSTVYPFVRNADSQRAAYRCSVAIAATCVIISAALETKQAQPYALTYYNAFAGGAPGGADLGMNRQFWGVSARGVLPFLNEQAATLAPGTKQTVYSHDASPAWGWYQKRGDVSKALSDAGMEQQGIDRSDFAIVIHEKHFLRHDYMIWQSYKTVQPVFVLRSDGVPIVSVYRRAPR
jgi:hypothetical protein